MNSEHVAPVVSSSTIFCFYVGLLGPTTVITSMKRRRGRHAHCSYEELTFIKNVADSFQDAYFKVRNTRAIRFP
jgi:hypothetical protein